MSRRCPLTMALAGLLATALPAGAGAQEPAAPGCTVVAPELAAGRYSGPCVDGRAHGQGRITDPTTGHTLYEGGFERGLRHGHGRFTFGPGSPWQGDRYEGQWQADRFHGHGRYRWVHGDVYEGPWAHGEQAGPPTAGQQRRAAHLAALVQALPATGHQVCTLKPQAGQPAQARVLSIVDDRLQLQPDGTAPTSAPFWSPAAGWRPCTR